MMSKLQKAQVDVMGAQLRGLRLQQIAEAFEAGTALFAHLRSVVAGHEDQARLAAAFVAGILSSASREPDTLRLIFELAKIDPVVLLAMEGPK